MAYVEDHALRLWLTYAWIDNENEDVDHVVQMLEKKGIDVKYDRIHLIPGRRLWSQLDEGITSPDRSDAWAIFVTKHSLESEACQEELAYALDRALRSRGSDFPLIGIFPESIDRSIIPSSLATRLYVDLRDENWPEQVLAGLEGRAPYHQSGSVLPYTLSIYDNTNGSGTYIEVRPRSGRWYPFNLSFPPEIRPSYNLTLTAPRGREPIFAGTFRYSGDQVRRHGYNGPQILEAVDAQTSAYVLVNISFPFQFAFGNDDEMFAVELREDGTYIEITRVS